MVDFMSRLTRPQVGGFTPRLLPPKSLPRPALLGTAEGAATLAGFDLGKANLKPGHVEKLQAMAETYRGLLGSHPAGKVRAVGHTDTVGTEADNDALGQARADAVRDELVTLGVDVSSIETRSLGESVPAVETQKPEAANRRVELYFMPGPDYSSLLSGGLTPPQTLGPVPELDVRRPHFDYCRIFPEDCDPTRWPAERYKPIPPIKGPTKRAFTEAVWEPIDEALKRGLNGLGIKGEWNERLRGWAKTGAKKGAEEGLDAILDAAGATGDAKKAAAAALKAAVELEVPF